MVEATPFLERHSTPELLLLAEREWEDAPEAYVLELKAGARALLLCGRVDLARTTLGRLASHEWEYEYELKIVERGATLLRLLDEGDAALGVLTGWERETSANFEKRSDSRR